MLIRVLDEISEVLGDRTELTADDLDKLTYLQQVTTIIIIYTTSRGLALLAPCCTQFVFPIMYI